MPRNTDEILYSLEANPAIEPRYGGLGRVWYIYPNTIASPAGKNRGRYSTMDALKKVQSRYWNKGVPMGMELELELPGSSSNTTCECECFPCLHERDHQACESSSDECHYWRDTYYTNYEPVREILLLTNKRVMEGMRHYAQRKDRDTFRYVHPISAKGDGSLTNGVEFNYQPMTVSAFTKYAASAYQDIGYSKFVGHTAGTAGIHIHIPKAAFSDPELYMFILLFKAMMQTTNVSGKSFLEVMAQRSFGRWNHETMPYFGARDNFLSVVTERRSNAGKYNAFNFSGHGSTMEIRAFNSNQRPDRLIKNMSLVDMSWRYVHLLMDFLEDEKYKQALQFLSDVNLFAGYLTNPNAKGYTDELGRFVRAKWRRQPVQYPTFGADTLSTLIQLNETFQSRDWETQNTEGESTDE